MCRSERGSRALFGREKKNKRNVSVQRNIAQNCAGIGVCPVQGEFMYIKILIVDIVCKTYLPVSYM